jgi:predicted enzyme related to lactoylglutathione lyase
MEIQMSQTASSFRQSKADAGVARVDMKFEVALIPVSDIDRAKEFYTRLGWRLDDDIVAGEDFRAVQLTRPWFGVLDHLRQGSHGGGTWLVSRWADCFQH